MTPADPLNPAPAAGILLNADEKRHRDMANAVRALAMDAVEAAKSGHPGMPMGMADVATVLLDRFLRFDPARPDWSDRDRLVLSAGHGSMLLYALGYLTGYADMPIEELKRFRQLGSRTAGHPEYGHGSMIETTTGPLGQGLATGVGMAISAELMAARHGRDLVDHYIYVMAGDGCLMEGVSQEAISLAGHLHLRRLIVLFDDNRITIDGPTGLSTSEDQLGRFTASGWAVERIDGHDPKAIAQAIDTARKADRPSLIACRTTIGYGAPTKAGTAAAHGAALGEKEIAGARQTLDWPYAPFDVPAPILAAWRGTAGRGAAARSAWEKRLDALPADRRDAYRAAQRHHTPPGLDALLEEIKGQFAGQMPNWATRKSSQEVLEVITPRIDRLIGGSADLTGSNNTKSKVMTPITADDFTNRYLHYGIREHGMAAAMNGNALHGGFNPYGGTFLVFSDYLRPALRLSALMGLGVIYVLTHDSIGLGEDGPTHQPVEHLASRRAVPNLQVFRPADAIETAECWILALKSRTTPSVLALSRQNLPALRNDSGRDNRCARGAYVLAEAEGARQVTLLATGSEVHLAMAARDLLAREGVAAAVVSMPCWELFDSQDETYCRAVLGTAPRVAVEAAVAFGWTRYVASEDDVVAMPGFGASAPADDLYNHFAITPQAIAQRARTVMKRSG
ncbi:MAG: transketolase [Alphaproteobacteria bacterium]